MNTQVVLSQLSLEDKIRLVLGQDNLKGSGPL